jgi:hypothetical protein
MTDITISREELLQLLREARSGTTPSGLGAPASGLGSAMRVQGIGCGDGGMGSMAAGVYEMLALGSPRLALARALGTRFAPYYMNFRATFANSTQTDVEEVGSDVKIVQDTLIDEVCFTILNKSDTANRNQFQAQSDYYFNKQSGIEITWDILGAPRPTITPKFTPLANIADGLLPFSRWPRGLILSYTQQMQMSFHASVVLPYTPIEVVITLQSWLPMSDKFVDMKNKDAIAGLSDCGFKLDDCFADRLCEACR